MHASTGGTRAHKSGTKGVTLNPFMKVLILDLEAQWQRQLANRKLKTTTNSEASVVDLTISAGGELVALRLNPL